MVGNLKLEQFVEGQQIIPLPLSGGVLEKATLDGRPAIVSDGELRDERDFVCSLWDEKMK